MKSDALSPSIHSERDQRERGPASEASPSAAPTQKRPVVTDTSLTTNEQPTRQALAVPGRSRALRVTGKLRKAIEFMVFNGSKSDYASAAAHAGLTAHAVRCALAKGHVKAFYNQQIEVLLTAERARTIHRFVEIRDAANNMPAVQAGRELNRVPDEYVNAGKALQPGFVVQIVNVQQVAEPAKASVQVIDP